MKNNHIKGILFEEINRSRQIMGLSLLTEGIGNIGGIGDDVADFFTRVGKSSIDDLTEKEKSLFNKLVQNSAELRAAGIKSIKDLSNPLLKKAFLNTLSTSKGSILASFTKSIDDYTSEALKKINASNRDYNLQNAIKTQKVSDEGSVLDMLQKIETLGISTYRPDTLELLRDELNYIKDMPSIITIPEAKKYIEDVVKEIDDNLKLREVSFGKQIDDLSLEGTTTTKSFDGTIDNVAGKVGDDAEMDEMVEKLLSKIEASSSNEFTAESIESTMKEAIDDLIKNKRVKVDNRVKLNEVVKEVSSKIDKKGKASLKVIDEVWNKMSFSKQQEYVNDAMKNIGSQLPPTWQKKIKKFLGLSWEGFKDAPSGKQLRMILGKIWHYGIYITAFYMIWTTTLEWKKNPNMSFEDKFNDVTLKILKTGFWWANLIVQAALKSDEETYKNTPEGFKKWVEKNNYTNPDYNGYWYTDNGTDKQASYSNGTWQ